MISVLVRAVAVTLASAFVWTLAAPAASQPLRLPGRLGQFVEQHVKLTADDYQRLSRGEPVTAALAASSSDEVGIFGAIWIKAPIATYVASISDVEHFYAGSNFIATKKISRPPRLEDFDQLTLPPDDVKDLRTCRIQSCDVKLGEAALQRIQKEVDWTKPLPEVTAQVESLFKMMALEYAAGYEKTGDAALAVYRDKRRPTVVAREFKAMVDGMPVLTEYLPELKQYLLAYPNASLPGAESFLFWQSVTFGLKPTTRINHVVIVQRPGSAAIMSKMIYSSHYFWTALELHLLMEDPARGQGFWFATISQSRSDELGGIAGPIVRRKVRDEAMNGAAAALAAAKTAMERSGGL